MPPANQPLCIIPAYNAEPTVASVVLGIRSAVPEAFVLVADDGSKDATRSAARAVADQTLEFDVNRGKGAVLRDSFAFALERGFERVVTIDADGQHDPAFLPTMFKALTTADIVIGSRQISGKSVPFHRRIANMISSGITRAVAGVSISDSQSGYRAIRADVLRAVDVEGDRYEFENAFLIVAARKGFRFAEVPISTVYGTATASNFRPIRDAIRVMRIIWKYRSYRA